MNEFFGTVDSCPLGEDQAGVIGEPSLVVDDVVHDKIRISNSFIQG